MKVKDVRCELYLREPPQPPRRVISPLVSGKVALTVLRIITDDGIEGFFFGDYRGDLNEQAVNIIRHEIIDRDPFEREWIWQRLWSLRGYGQPITLGVMSAVDIALWDIAGKALRTPIYKLMGAYRDKVKVYASSWWLPTLQEYTDDVLFCKQKGITAYKIHCRETVKETINICRAVRQAAGDNMELMLDVNGKYNREEALRIGEELEELNFHWFEEPIPDYDIEGLIKLREKLRVPICALESRQNGMFSVPEYLLRRACDIVRCDTAIQGGITPCKKIADMCDAFGMQCELHTWDHTGGGIPNLHLECAIKNCEFYEMQWPELRYGLKEYPVLDDEGYIHVPQKPGLGVEIDWEALGKPVAS